MTRHQLFSARPRLELATALLLSPLAFIACGSDDEGESKSELDACRAMNPDNPAACVGAQTDDGSGLIDDGTTGGPAGSGSPSPSGDVNADSACADSNTYIGRSEPAALQLLVDTSCSMSQQPGQDAPGGGMGGGVIDGPESCDDEPEQVQPFNCGAGGLGEGSKWQITRDALGDALGAFGDATWLGLMFYPYPPGTPAEQIFAGNRCECYPDVSFFLPQNTVPAAALDDAQRALVSGALDDALVTGSTPTHAAYRQAVDYLRSATFTGAKYVVLITDGEPTYGLTDTNTCFGIGTERVNSTALVAEVAAALTGGIQTFVIGSPGSEPAREDLSRMAEEGGTARAGCSSAPDSDTFCHLDMTTEPDFGAALAGALGQVAEETQDPCAYDLPMPGDGQSIDRGRVNVSYTDANGNAVQITRDPSLTECNSGWQYSEDQNTILLCPDACGAVTAGGNTDVNILVGCQPTAIGGVAR